jgi:hypothetical protein
MTAYELLFERIRNAFIEKKGDPNDKLVENLHVVQASIMSGIIAALFTNCLEVIVIRQ